MPRIKRTINGIKMLSEDEIAIIDEFINSSEGVKKAADELKHIFQKHFCFKEEEIKLYIYNICEQLENDVVYKIRDLCKAFEENDIKDFDKEKRNPLARSVFDDIISLFKDKVRHISESFEDVLDMARTLHIDPFKLAIKTNLEKLTEENFEQTINSLTKEKYLDSHTEEYSHLFTNEEFKDALEHCATLANQATSERVAKIFNLLNNLFWDENAKAYLYDVRDIIKSAPSILSCPPATIENTIEMLKTFYEDSVGGRAKLLQRIKLSPTILTVDFNRITSFNSIFAKTIESIIASKKNPTAIQKNAKKYSQSLADELVFDINRLTQIDKLKTETMPEKAEILTKYLGVDNAITCLQNTSILQASPQYLELALASIIQEEMDSKINLRQTFVENPSRILNQYENTYRDNGGANGEAEIERAKKKQIIVSEFPEIFLSNAEFESIKRKAGNKKVGISQKLIDKLVKEAREEEAKRKALEVERLKAEAQEAERYRQARKEERQRKKEEEREKKRLQKIAEKERFIAQRTANSQQVAINTEKELTLEEKQALRCSKVPKVKPISKELSIFQTYLAQYEPIFEAFKLNNYYPKNLPRFSKIKEALTLFEDTSIEAYELSKQIIEYAKFLQDKILDKKNEMAITNLSYIITDKDYTDITGKGLYIFERVKDINKKYNKVFNIITESFKKNSEAAKVFAHKYISNDNLFMKVGYLRDIICEYAYAIEEEAEAFFGKKCEEMFFPDYLQDSIKFVQSFTNNFYFNLNCNAPLLYDIYCVSLHEVLFHRDSRISKKWDKSVLNPLQYNNDLDSDVPSLNPDLLFSFVSLLDEEVKYLYEVNSHTFPFYNLNTGNFIIQYQSNSAPKDDCQCYSAHVTSDNERCHPGLKPAVLSDNFPNLPLKLHFINLSQEDEKKQFLTFNNEETENQDEEAVDIDEIIKIINEVKNSSDNEGEGE